MSFTALMYTFKDIVYPVLGTLIAFFLVSFIPGVADNREDY